MSNTVNKNFLKDSYFIKDLNLCSVRLINNSKFPWIILIPKKKNANAGSVRSFAHERGCSACTAGLTVECVLLL